MEVGVGLEVHGADVGKKVAGKSSIHAFPNHDALNTLVGTSADYYRTVIA